MGTPNTSREVQLIRACILARCDKLVEAGSAVLNDETLKFEYDPIEDTLEEELPEPKKEWILEDSYGITCWDETWDDAIIDAMKTSIIEEIRPYIEVETVHSVVWSDEAISSGLFVLSDAIKHEWCRVAGKMQHPFYWDRSEPNYTDYWDEWDPFILWGEVPQHIQPYIERLLFKVEVLISQWFEEEDNSGESSIDFTVPTSIVRNIFRMTCEAMDLRNVARLTRSV